MKGYIFLILAIVTEVLGTTMLKLSEGFTHVLPSLGVFIGFGLAFYCLSLCLKTIPLSLAYAIWSGAGTALTALIGVLVWKDPFNIGTCLGLVFIIGGIIALQLSTSKSQKKKSDSQTNRLDCKIMVQNSEPSGSPKAIYIRVTLILKPEANRSVRLWF